MNDIALRIRELIDSENLSNKEFAQRLSINPSIISHILSGRNKVSLQVVEQILKEFTNVSLDYILLGTGSLFKEVTNVNYNSVPISEPISKELVEKRAEIPVPLMEKSDKKELKNVKPPIPSSSEIDQVIIFYNDGSFKIYKP